MHSAPNGAIAAILKDFGLDRAALLGYGGEAFVYALDAGRVLRIFRQGATADAARRRHEFLSNLDQARGQVPFAIPQVLSVIDRFDRPVTIEQRLAGRSLVDALPDSSDAARTQLIRAYLSAAAAIADIDLRRPWYGELAREDAIRTSQFRDYLAQRAAASLSAAGPEFAGVSPTQLAADLPEPDRPQLVHLDAFPGNMLTDGKRITAVIDFGAVSLMGDRRLDPVSAAIYLERPITPAATDTDRAVAAAWLATAGLARLVRPARRWLAAFWSFARDDPPLYDWCRSVLLEDTTP